MDPPRNYHAEIMRALVAADVERLASIASELAGMVTSLGEQVQRFELREAERKEYNRAKQRKSYVRLRKLTSDSVRPPFPPNGPPLALSPPLSPPNPDVPRGRPATWLSPYLTAWKGSYHTEFGSAGQMAKWVRPVHDQLGEGESVKRWGRYLAATELEYASPRRFHDTHAAYADQAQGKGQSDDGGRQLRIAKVQNRRAQNDGDEWWSGIQQEARAKGITKAGDVYEYAHGKL